MRKRSDIDQGIGTHLDEDGNPFRIRRTFVVERECQGLRVDQFLKKKIPRLSRNRIQRIVREQLEIDGNIGHKPNRRVQFGNELVIERVAEAEPPCPRTFTVLHRDPEVLVITKPAGLPMHASARFYFNTLTAVMRERMPEANYQMCHRLDRETSGVVVFAAGKRAAGIVKKQFAKRQIEKQYLAVVHGLPAWAQTKVVDAPLRLVEANDDAIDIRMVVASDGLPSVTAFRVLAQGRDKTLLLCQPRTGRQHQIRAHLAHAGFPIVGDKLYAHGDEIFREYCAHGYTENVARVVGCRRQALHAASIVFRHPCGRLMRFHAPLPRDMQELLT